MRVMPRFYLNLRDGPQFFEDGEGVELPDRLAAHSKAVESLRSVMTGTFSRVI